MGYLLIETYKILFSHILVSEMIDLTIKRKWE